MRKVSAQSVLDEAIKYHHNRDLKKAEALYHDILNNNIGQPVVLYFLGTLAMERGQFGMGICLLEYVVKAQPDLGEAWNNLGLCYRAVNDFDSCREKLEEALKRLPIADIPMNISSTYINEGQPLKCIEWCDRALAIDPNHLKAQWHKALALLEMQNWKKAWPLHEVRLKEGAASHDIAKRNYHGPEGQTQWWDGGSGEFVVIHGEQGVGDEIMFASCIPDALESNSRFVLECSPRLQGLMQRSFPDIDVRGTDATDGHEWIPELGKPDKKTALGSLPKFYRTTPEDFPGTPFLKPDPKRVQEWARRFEAKEFTKPKIGIAWQGGVVKTRVDLRSIFPEQLIPILKQDAHFISLQYTADGEGHVDDLRSGGFDVHYYSEAQAQDIDDVAGLIASLDLVITVCQTAVHIAGGLGVECWCLTPSKPSWRYGVVGNMPWYNSVDLIRMEGEDWTPVIEKTAKRLEKWIEDANYA